jgi:hypothetical protein
MTINLNEQQLKNLNVFLARVDLKGSEVNAFNELVSVLFNPAPSFQPGMPESKPESKVEEAQVEEAKVEGDKDEIK